MENDENKNNDIIESNLLNNNIPYFPKQSVKISLSTIKCKKM